MKTKIRPCESCEGKIGPVFYVIKSSRMMVNYNAVQRHAGLTMMLGGHEPLAAIFSPDSSLETELDTSDEVVLCQDCVLQSPILRKVLFKEPGE